MNIIWKYAPNRFGRGDKGYDDTHPLAKKLKISGYELMMIMAFIEEQGLIEYDASEHNWINLTSKGFDVALQNRSEIRASKINKGSLFFSGIVAVFTVVTLLTGITDIFQKWFITGIIVLGMIAIGYITQKI